MRLDKYLVEQKLASSRSKAVNLIKLGKVYVNEKRKLKQSYNVKPNDSIRIDNPEYASRGAYKLEKVIKHFNINIENSEVLDIGCSFGGFTDYFIRNGAKTVYAVDIS